MKYIFRILIWVKYVSPLCGLTPLFFFSCGLFHIVDDTLGLVKDGYGISVKKLTVVYINATKPLLKVDTCPRCHISLPSQLRV